MSDSDTNDIDDIIRRTAERKRREIVEDSFEKATEHITKYFYEASGIHVPKPCLADYIIVQTNI